MAVVDVVARRRCKMRQRSLNGDEYSLKLINGCKYRSKLECGPMPNVMTALPNIGGALCSMTQSLADAHCWSAVQ